MRRAPTGAAVLVIVALWLSASVSGALGQRDASEPTTSRAAGLRYRETVTGGADPEAALPLVVALHQLGAGPRGAALVFDEGIECPARIVAPRGHIHHPPGFSFIDAVAADPDDVLAPALRRGAARLARFIEEVRRERPTTGTPIVTGFSQGGMLTFALAALHPESVGVAIPGAGSLPRALWPDGERPLSGRIIAFHGALDGIVPQSGARDTIEHFRRLGVDARLVTHSGVGHRFTRRMKGDLRAWVSAEVRARAECSI